MNPHIPARPFKTEVISNIQLTHKVYELTLSLLDSQNIEFYAGQFAMFIIDEKTRRPYSIVSTPTSENELVFCADVSPNGPGSILIKNAKAGDVIHLQAPYGIFTVQNFDRDILFVATGVGIAPFKSIIANLFENKFQKQITLIFGVRSEQDIFYFDYFKSLAESRQNFLFYPMLSQPQGQWHGFVGRVTKFLEKNGELYHDRQIYICGDTAMIKDVRKLLKDKSVAAENIKFEFFG